jgi:hypothetical protein
MGLIVVVCGFLKEKKNWSFLFVEALDFVGIACRCV